MICLLTVNTTVKCYIGQMMHEYYQPVWWWVWVGHQFNAIYIVVYNGQWLKKRKRRWDSGGPLLGMYRIIGGWAIAPFRWLRGLGMGVWALFWWWGCRVGGLARCVVLRGPGVGLGGPAGWLCGMAVGTCGARYIY